MDTQPDSMGAEQARSEGRAIPLTQLPSGAQARVVRVVHDADGHWRKLSALGIVPGTMLQLVQRFPTYALRTGLAMVAIDKQLAALIEVEPL